MIDYETTDVTELKRRGRGRSAFTQAFEALPEGKAMFRQREEARRLAKTASNALTTLKSAFPDRRVHTQLDHQKDGVWVWWEVLP